MSNYNFKINHHPAVALSDYHKDKLINEHHLNDKFNDKIKDAFFCSLGIKPHESCYYDGVFSIKHPLAHIPLVDICFGGVVIKSCKNESHLIAHEIYEFITCFLTIEKCLSK